MDDEPLNERDLIKAAQAGDRDARRALFEQISERIYRLLLRMTGNPEDASDLTQETFVRGFQRIDQFRGQSAIATWFYRVAVNLALQYRRREAIATQKIQALAPLRPIASDGTTTDLRIDLEEALVELPAEDRAILLLRYQEGLDYREITAVLECAEGTVASRLSRARERLRTTLRKSYG